MSILSQDEPLTHQLVVSFVTYTPKNPGHYWRTSPSMKTKVGDFAKPVKAITLPQDVPSTSDRRLIELETQVQRLMEAHLAPIQPTQVNKITTSCEICSGPHDTQYYMENFRQAFVVYASSRTNEVKLEKALLDFDSHQEKRLSYLRTQLEQQQDDMIGKINLLGKTIFTKLNDASTPKNAGNSMAPKSIVAISHAEKEELRKKGIKSPSKFELNDTVVEAQQRTRQVPPPLPVERAMRRDCRSESQLKYAKMQGNDEEDELEEEEDEEEHRDTLCGACGETTLQMNSGSAVIYVRGGSMGSAKFHRAIAELTFEGIFVECMIWEESAVVTASVNAVEMINPLNEHAIILVKKVESEEHFHEVRKPSLNIHTYIPKANSEGELQVKILLTYENPIYILSSRARTMWDISLINVKITIPWENGMSEMHRLINLFGPIYPYTFLILPLKISNAP
ncbi:hypothetical protein Tco_0284914 [Tanacetum coccineum]